MALCCIGHMRPRHKLGKCSILEQSSPTKFLKHLQSPMPRSQTPRFPHSASSSVPRWSLYTARSSPSARGTYLVIVVYIFVFGSSDVLAEKAVFTYAFR